MREKSRKIGTLFVLGDSQSSTCITISICIPKNIGLKITDFISMNSAYLGELENNTLYPLSLTLKLPLLIHSNGCEFIPQLWVFDT